MLVFGKDTAQGAVTEGGVQYVALPYSSPTLSGLQFSMNLLLTMSAQVSDQERTASPDSELPMMAGLERIAETRLVEKSEGEEQSTHHRYDSAQLLRRCIANKLRVSRVIRRAPASSSALRYGVKGIKSTGTRVSDSKHHRSAVRCERVLRSSAPFSLRKSAASSRQRRFEQAHVPVDASLDCCNSSIHSFLCLINALASGKRRCS